MIYEIKIALRTIKREGLIPLFKKICSYFLQMFRGVWFFFLKLPTKATSAELVDFSFKAAGGVLQTAQVRSEIILLAETVKKNCPKTVVEIGTAHGGTLFLWCRLADPNAVIISIDLPGGGHGGGYPWWKSWLYQRFSFPSQKLHLLRGDSHKVEMLKRVKNLLPDKAQVDFLFIDGDHTYEGVKMDYEMYSGLVRPGGLIVFHDICKHAEHLNCQVDLFWKEIKHKRRTSEFVHDWNQGICGIGIIEV